MAWEALAGAATGAAIGSAIPGVGTVVGGAAGLVLGGLFGGSRQKGPTYINIKYPEPDPIEQEIAKIQLDMAKDLYEKVKDPTLMRDIYKLLPETNMSKEDRARFTDEYAKISQEATVVAMGEAGKAAGEDLDSLVARGVMTQSQADRQRVENEARIRAMTSILNKRLEASRIGFTRNAWVQDQQANIGVASTISKIDQANKSLLNATLQGGLNYFQQRSKNAMALQSSLANANLQTYADTSKTKSDFMMNALGMGAKVGLDAYSLSKVPEDQRAFAKILRG